nr:MAG TPA: hypothetical protein [Caudoviricetes sp.]
MESCDFIFILFLYQIGHSIEYYMLWYWYYDV